MTDHTVTAYEPRIHEIDLENVNGEIREVREVIERPPNWRNMWNYECSCGEEFRNREQAEAHLKPC